MPTYNFEGRKRNGEKVVGERIATSADVIGNALLQEGVTPIHIRLKGEAAHGILRFNFQFRQKVDNKSLALFTRQMYTISKAGVPISNGMRHLAKTVSNTRLAEALTGIAQQLEAGQNLANAMENYPDVFTPLMIAMVQIGQNTGRLDNVFLQLANHLEMEESTFKRVKAAVRYPTFVICAIIIGVIIINLFVVPAFAKVYSQSGVPLPGMTRVLITVSNFILHNWLYALGVLAALIYAIYRYLKTSEGRYKWHKFQLRLPIIGHLLHQLMLLRFAETFAIVVNAGVPINEGLNLVMQSIPNQYVKSEVKTMKDAIQHGSSILNAASNSKLFTSLELQMLMISEQTGELGNMLNEITLYYQRELDYDIKHLTDLIEPILIGGVALIVVFLALAVYMPIWNMIKLVRG